MSPDDRLVAVNELTIRLRRILQVHFGFVPADALATALTYELTSIIANAAATRADAIAAVTAFAETQVDQIRAFGVGKPHP